MKIKKVKYHEHLTDFDIAYLKMDTEKALKYLRKNKFAAVLW